MKNIFFILFLCLCIPSFLTAQVNKKGKTKRDVTVPLLTLEASEQPALDVLFPYQDAEIDTLDFKDSIPDAHLIFYTKKIAKRAIQLENIIINNRLRVTYSKQVAEDAYAALKEKEDADKDELKALKSNIKALKKEEKRLTKARMKAKKITGRIVELEDAEADEIRKEFPAVRDAVLVLGELAGRSRDWIEQDLEYLKGENEALAHLPSQEQNPTIIEKAQNESDMRMGEASEAIREGESVEASTRFAFLQSKPSDYVTYDIEDDVLMNPPSIPCRLPVDAVDQFSGKIHKQTADAELFRYTNDFMRKYLGGKPHIQCFASSSQLGEVVAVILTVHVRDNNAKNAFGGIKQNNNLTFKFIDGITKSSPNLREETPLLLEDGAVTVYKGSFPLGKALLKKLRTTELDKVRIQWNTGYEDYEIFNIDLLSQQVDCLLD